jgi:hypothetical protein
LNEKKQAYYAAFNRIIQENEEWRSYASELELLGKLNEYIYGENGKNEGKN